eukprot:6097633-Pyramimonas_sp.AAC.1
MFSRNLSEDCKSALIYILAKRVLTNSPRDITLSSTKHTDPPPPAVLNVLFFVIYDSANAGGGDGSGGAGQAGALSEAVQERAPLPPGALRCPRRRARGRALGARDRPGACPDPAGRPLPSGVSADFKSASRSSSQQASLQ